MDKIYSFGDWMRHRRKVLDLTQAALAKQVGCAVITIKKIEQGVRRPSLEMAELLATHLAVPTSERDRFVRMGRGLFTPLEILPTDVLRFPAFLEVHVDKPSAPFVSRKPELSQLQWHLDQALAGESGVVFVSGEAGRGKTSLLRAFARQAQSRQTDLIVASGECSAPGHIGDPYLPFRDIWSLLVGNLEPRLATGTILSEQAQRLWTFLPQVIKTIIAHGPDLFDVLISKTALIQRITPYVTGDPDWLTDLQSLTEQQDSRNDHLEQNQLFEQVRQVLQALAAQQPLLLLLDDLQWIDTASLNLLFHLGRRLKGGRVLLIGAYRASEVNDDHSLASVINEFKRRLGDIQLDLEAFDPEASRNFVDALLDTEPNYLDESFRERLFWHTKGYPLFTVELLRHLQEQGNLIQDKNGHWIEKVTFESGNLPVRIEAVINQRLNQLDAELQELLKVAAVEGEIFTVQAVSQIQQRDDRLVLQQLSKLAQDQGLAREYNELQIGSHYLSQYQFAHSLFQQYLYQNLSVGERRLLHAQMAAALERIYADKANQFAAKLAHHFVEAGKDEKAIDYLIEAGDQARSLYAYKTAIDYYEQALVFLKAIDDFERRSRLLMKLGLSYHMELDFQRAGQAYEAGFQLWQHIGNNPSTVIPTSSSDALRIQWWEPAILDPVLVGQVEALSIIDQLFSGLVEANPDMDIVPNVAQSWEVLDGGRTYLFHLRQDAQWNDGTPVTAEDFEYAWKRLLDPATNARAALILYDIRGARAFHQGDVSTADHVGVSTIDQMTLKVELEGPTSYFLHLLASYATYPVPRHIVELHGQRWSEPENIVTNGPFQLEAWHRSERMVLIRNTEYHGQYSGNIDRIELSFAPDPLQLYEDDEIDVLSHFTLRFMPKVQQDWMRQRFTDDLISAPGLYTNCIGFDTSQPPFDDVRVRQAFVLATNRESLVMALRSQDLPATGGFLPPGMPGHSPEIGMSYDPNKALELLAKCGYPQGQSFPQLNVLVTSGQIPYWQNLQTQWRQHLNIDISWEEVDVPQYSDKLAQEPRRLYIFGWMAEYTDPINFLHANKSLQRGQWHNKTFTNLVECARRETDHAQRMILYRQADKLLIEEAAIMPLTYGHKQVLVKPWVKKYPISALKFWFWKDVVIERANEA